MKAIVVVADVPSAGEKCFPCFLEGHYCRATAFWFDVPVCAACGMEEMCEQRKRVQRMLRSNEIYEGVV